MQKTITITAEEFKKIHWAISISRTDGTMSNVRLSEANDIVSRIVAENPWLMESPEPDYTK